MSNIARTESVHKRLKHTPPTKLPAWRARVFTRESQPAGDPQALYEWLSADALSRKSPLSFKQRVAVHTIAHHIAHGDADCIKVRELARAVRLTAEKTHELVDTAPGFFMRRGFTVYLVHPDRRETWGRP